MKSTTLIRMTQALFYLNAAVWVVLGIASLALIKDGPAYTPWIIAILMFGNAAALLLCGWGIGTRHNGFLYLALVVMGVNILLTFTDQVGALDLATLAIDVILLGLLIGVWRNRNTSTTSATDA